MLPKGVVDGRGRRDLRTTVLYGFPLRDPGDMMSSDLDRRFLPCSECASPLEKALTCSSCLAALYCNATCQKAAWGKGHKQECRDLKEDRKTSNGTTGMFQPPPRAAGNNKVNKKILSGAIKDWIFDNSQAITVLAKLNVQGDRETAINHHTYISLLSRTIPTKGQGDGYRLTINSVFRVNRDRDPGPYTDKYDGATFPRSDNQHIVQIFTEQSGIHGFIISLDQFMECITPDIPVHALVNMYNSSLQNLAVTAGRKAPGFGDCWKKAGLFEPDNVIAKKVKEFGVDKIPQDARDRFLALLKEIDAKGENLWPMEIGDTVTRPDGRTEFVPKGYKLNGHIVEPALHPFFRMKFSEMSKEDAPYVLANDPASLARNNKSRGDIDRAYYELVLQEGSTFSEEDKLRATKMAILDCFGVYDIEERLAKAKAKGKGKGKGTSEAPVGSAKKASLKQ